MIKKDQVIKGLGIGSMCLLLFGCSKETLLVPESGEEPGIIKEEVVWEETDTETSSEETTKEDVEEKTISRDKEVKIAVHICGAVMQPGVYYLNEGQRVYDGIQKAGGFREDADQDYLNQALMLEDGKKLVVPTKEEAGLLRKAAKEEGRVTVGILSENTEETQKKDGKVDLNTADETLLCTLPGIGESRAKSILAYRKEHGPFETTEDIMKVSGIKEAAFEKIKDQIMVSR